MLGSWLVRRVVLYKLLFHWRVFPVGPLEHGGIVISSLIVAQHPEQEGAVRRTEASLSIGEYRLIWSNPMVFKNTPQLPGRLEPVAIRLHQVRPLQVNGAGDMALPTVAAGHPAIVFLLGPRVPGNYAGEVTSLHDFVQFYDK